VLLAVHGAKHFWSCLGWICDIAELCQAAPGFDWELSERTATQMKCRRMWLLALFLAHHLLDCPLPPAVLAAIRKDSGIDPLFRRVQALLLEPTGVGPSAPQRLSFRLRSYENRMQGFRQCVRLMVGITEEDWKSSALPAWLAPVYVALRPVRLLRKHGFRF
jgi:hypothetical protein